jgi:hypothetical protein
MLPASQEEGLNGERTAVRLYGEILTLEYADDILAVYQVRDQPDGTAQLDVSEPGSFATPHRSPQPHLWGARPKGSTWCACRSTRRVCDLR